MQPYTTKLTSKGQVTIPAEIRHLLGLAPHDKVTFLVEADQVKIAPASSVTARTAGVLGGPEPMLTPREEKMEAETSIAREAAERGYQAQNLAGRRHRKSK